MSAAGSPAVNFPPFRLDVSDRRLYRGDQVLTLRPKTLAVLAHLLEHRGRLVTKDELLDACWPETCVGDSVLKVCIREIREALGDTAQSPRFIETAHRLGYRFIGQVLAPATTQPRRSAGAPAARGAAFASPVPRVGREADLAQLRDLLQAARDGRRQVVFVTGEAGIGKTTLVDMLLDEVSRDREIWTAHGQCLEQYGASEPYLPILDAISRLCRETGCERLIDVLRRYAPSWLAQMPSLIDVSEREQLQRGAVSGTRERMLREMADALESLTAETPLVFVLEDLHWSDYSTVDLISYLAMRSAPARMLLIATYRPVDVILSGHPLTGTKRELEVRGRCTEVDLGFLDVGAVAEYLQARFRWSRPSDDLVQLIHERTDGNPLFMVNVVDYLIGARLIVEHEGSWKPSAPVGDIAVGVPDGVKQMIEKQIDRLSAADRQILEVAAVAGVEFSAAAVAAAMDTELSRVEERCDTIARHRQFVRAAGMSELPDGSVTSRYAFIHALYQHALNEQVAPARRARLHRRIGEHEETVNAGRTAEMASELAMHFAEGRDYARAADYLGQAVENALRRFANREAVTLSRRGIELLARLPASSDRDRRELSLQVALGVSLMALRGYAAPEVEQAYARARELCQPLGDALQLFPALWGLARFYLVRSPLETARELGEQLLRIAEREQDPHLVCQATNPLAESLLHLGELTRARGHLERALDLYDRRSAGRFDHLYLQDPEGVCSVLLALALWNLGYPDAALARVRSAVTRAERLSHPFGLAMTQIFAAMVHQLRREHEATRDLAESAVAIATAEEFPELLLHARFMYGCALVEIGDAPAGFEHLRGAAELGELAGVRLWRPSRLALLATAHVAMGQMEEALAGIGEAIAAAEQTNERYGEPEIHRLRGEWLLRSAAQVSPSRSVEREAEACFRRAIEIARTQGAQSWALRAATSLARLLRDRNRAPEAKSVLGEVYGWFTEAFDTADLVDARTLLDELSERRFPKRRPRRAPEVRKRA